jgi:hypothetical protein
MDGRSGEGWKIRRRMEDQEKDGGKFGKGVGV